MGLVREVAGLGAGETMQQVLVEVAELLDKVSMGEIHLLMRRLNREVAVVVRRERVPPVAVLQLG